MENIRTYNALGLINDTNIYRNTIKCLSYCQYKCNKRKAQQWLKGRENNELHRVKVMILTFLPN